MSDSLRPHEPQHTRPSCPSPTPGVHSDSQQESQPASGSPEALPEPTLGQEDSLEEGPTHSSPQRNQCSDFSPHRVALEPGPSFLPFLAFLVKLPGIKTSLLDGWSEERGRARTPAGARGRTVRAALRAASRIPPEPQARPRRGCGGLRRTRAVTCPLRRPRPRELRAFFSCMA